MLLSCNSLSSYRNVGDIKPNRSLYHRDFVICDESNIKQYYARNSPDLPASYKGEKKELVDFVLANYHYPMEDNQDGYITIRFVVNCYGQPGRFTIQEMDNTYKEYRFPDRITSQLLKRA